MNKVELVHGLAAQILKVLGNAVRELEKLAPDQRSNVGKTLASMYIWDEIAKLAKRRSDDLWDRAAKDLYTTDALNPGVHTLAESPAFMLVAKISEPVRRFSAEELAKLMKAKYKVPEPMTRQLCDEAKVPTKSSVSLSIMER